mgnify:CR=1 FL=1
MSPARCLCATPVKGAFRLVLASSRSARSSVSAARSTANCAVGTADSARVTLATINAAHAALTDARGDTVGSDPLGQRPILVIRREPRASCAHVCPLVGRHERGIARRADAAAAVLGLQVVPGHQDGQVLGHAPGLDRIDGGLFQRIGEGQERVVAVELGTVAQAPRPREDRGGGVGGGVVMAVIGLIKKAMAK